MELLETMAESCPCCGAAIELTIERSPVSQSYIEDCPVCCQPMLVNVAANDGGEIDLSLQPENG